MASKPQPLWLRWWVWIGAMLVLVLMGSLFGGGSDRSEPSTSGNTVASPSEPSSSSNTAASWVAEYGGQLSAYQRILTMTSCDDLQEQFDIAADNNERAQAGTAEFRWTLGYMTAADEQLEKSGCYG